jgi:hypothetical protein
MLPKNYLLPAVVYSSISRHAIESLRGPNLLEISRYQFDSYATGVNGFYTSVQLSRAVKDALFPPDAGGNPTSLKLVLPDGTGVDSTRLILELDKPFELGEGGYIFCRSLDVEISFAEVS